MDNVVQNISIGDIIPSNFQPTNEEFRKIEELAQLIKQFGLLDPILVRPKNGKYEIVLGIDKYQAAKIAKLDTVPAIIKEVDDETYSKYSNIDNNLVVSLNSLPTENFSTKEKNSDVINLSELSKIKIEYERDDLKMNNGQFNNDMINNNLVQSELNQTNQEPTFGGRFYPSLEDEPTNMNMMGELNQTSNAPAVPNNNNNLIDLTDLSIEKETTPIPTTDFGAPTMNIPSVEPNININGNQVQPNSFSVPIAEPAPMPTTDFGVHTMNIPSVEPAINVNSNQVQPNNFSIPTAESTTMSINDNIINLDNLQNNNPAVQPIAEPVSMEILNADFGAPQHTPNQFDMGPNVNLNIPQPQGINVPQNPIQPDFGLNQPNIAVLEPQFTNPQLVPSFDINPTAIMQPDLGPIAPVQTIETNIAPSKDVTPVTNTIKNLVISLNAFGYKINITEDDLPNMAKITIEVEK